MAKLEIAFLHLTIVYLLAFSCAAKDTCSEVQCRVLTVGENLASEFQDKASEEGVRIIYFNLEIGNDSYHPLEVKDEVFPDRWVWADAISEPMLSLPYDYDILSLGLLNYQARSMTIPLEDHPSGCLASLNSSCQNLVVGRALLDNVTRGGSGRNTEVLCVEMIENLKDGDQPDLIQLKYHCCSPNTTTIRCGLPVETEWFDAFKTILTLFSVVMFLYCPAFLLALPDCIFNLRNELEKEDGNWRPTCGDQDESIANQTRNGYEAIDENEEGPEDGHESTELIPIDDASPITCSTLLLAYVQRLPKLRLPFAMKLAIFLFCIAPFIFYVQVGVYLAFKHEYLDRVPPKAQIGALNFNCAQSVLPVLLVGLTLGAICLLLLFVGFICCLLCCSPVTYLFPVSGAVKLFEVWANPSNKYARYCLVVVFYIILLLLHLCFLVALSISVQFIVGIFGFTIMGLVLNTEIVSPYAAFFIVVTTIIDLCYANLQSRYKEMKGFILQSWQKGSQTERSDRDTIPPNLFWFVSDRAFPVRIEICVMFGKMAAIVTFLFLAVSSIIFFGNKYNISTAVSANAVFVSGVILGLFFKGLTKGENFSGWRKIKLKREIETAVKDFDRGRVSTSIPT